MGEEVQFCENSCLEGKAEGTNESLLQPRCLAGASDWWSPAGLPGGLAGCRGEKEEGIKDWSCKRTVSLSSELDWDFFLHHG